MQQNSFSFANFLALHAQTKQDMPLEPGQSRSIVAAFEQFSPKKKPFDVVLSVGGDTFTFSYKE